MSLWVAKKNLALIDYVDQLIDKTNCVVFFEIEISNINSGKIYIELFNHLCPDEAEIFRKLVTGEIFVNAYKTPEGYKNTYLENYFELNLIIFGRKYSRQHNNLNPFIINTKQTFKTENDILIAFIKPKNSAYNGVAAFISPGILINDLDYFVIGRIITDKSKILFNKCKIILTDSNYDDLSITIIQCGEM